MACALRERILHQEIRAGPRHRSHRRHCSTRDPDECNGVASFIAGATNAVLRAHRAQDPSLVHKTHRARVARGRIRTGPSVRIDQPLY